MPDSPIAIRLTSTSMAFRFLNLSYILYHALLVAGVFEVPSLAIGKEVTDQFHVLFERSRPEQIHRASLSVSQLNILLHYIAEICTRLTDTEKSSFKIHCQQALPTLKETWDKDYLKSAKAFCDQYEKQLQPLTSYYTVIRVLKL